MPESLWISGTNNGLVTSIDPITMEVLGEAEVGVGAESITFGASSVWIVGNAEGVVYRVHPETLERVGAIPTAANTAGIVFSGGFIYASSFGVAPNFEATVTVIEPAIDTVLDTIAVGRGAAGMTLGSAVGVTFESGRPIDSLSTIMSSSAKVSRSPQD